MNENRTSILAIVLSMLAGMGMMHLYESDEVEFAKKYSVIEECENIMAENNVPKPENVDRTGVINGYLKAYDDYTYYYDTDYEGKEYIERLVNAMPTANGCGFTIAFNDNDELVFEDVDPELYASQQGISAGDKVIAIDGELVAENDYTFAKKLLGKEGTVCKLVIEHNGTMKNIDLTRYSQEIDYGISYKMYGDTLCIKLKRFGMSVGSFIREDIADMEFDSVIIDLRNNPGGHTYDAVAVADIFVGDGYITDHYYTGTTTDYYTTASDDDINVPVAVLVNENTASSAEIVTAFLKQYNNATIVGTKTFGKGVFQGEEKLSDGGTLHYTQGYYTVGDWDCYHGKGIYPDIEEHMDGSLIGTDKDSQLQKALDVLGELH